MISNQFRFIRFGLELAAEVCRKQQLAYETATANAVNLLHSGKIEPAAALTLQTIADSKAAACATLAARILEADQINSDSEVSDEDAQDERQSHLRDRRRDRAAQPGRYGHRGCANGSGHHDG